MATLIDKTYFLTGLTGIPNSNATGAGACIGANIQAYIDIYEPEFLKKLLGDDLYDAYVLAPDEDRFVALIAQLRNATTKISPIANYVYFILQQHSQIVPTDGGDKQTNQSGMSSASNMSRMCAVWNHMIELNEIFSEWMDENYTDYPEYSGGCDSVYEKINIMNI
jgi:hypothetical protein